MAKYLITKDKLGNQIIYMNIELNSYKFSPKQKKSKKYINVDEVTIINNQMIDTILSIKFNKTFNKVLAIAQLITNDEDATDDAVIMCLDEVELLRQILLYKYQEFLSHEKYELFLSKLRIIENELRIKQIYIKEKALYLEQMMEEKKGRSR